jgi:DNA polymerase alpha subunit A
MKFWRIEKHRVKPINKALKSAAPDCSLSAYRPIISAEKEQSMLDDILGNLDTAPMNVPRLTPQSRKRKPSPPPCSSSPDHNLSLLSSEQPIPSSEDELGSSVRGKRRRMSTPGSPVPEVLSGNERSGEAVDASMTDEYDAFFMDDDIDDTCISKALEAKEMKPIPSEERQPTEKTIQPPWIAIHASLNAARDISEDAIPKPALSTSHKILEDDGCLYAYWLDYMEDDGKVLFFGKVREKTTGQWMSCCIAIQGIQRNLFVLPRTRGIGRLY